MNDEKILNSINEEIVKLTPDNYEEIKSKCQKNQQDNIMAIKPKKSNVKRYLAIAAAFAIVVCAVFAFYSPANRVASVIEIDVNPSIEISADKDDKIIEVVPLNADGVTIIDDMNFEGVDLDIAINALIGSMLRNGFITVTQNAILVSVASEDADKQQDLLRRVSDDINDVLTIGKVEGAVLTQSLTQEERIAALAEQYGISEGKALFIEYVCNENPNRTYESLVGFSISELALMLESDMNKLAQSDNLTEQDKAEDFKVAVSGEVNKASYIGEERAMEIAFAHADADRSEVTGLSIGFEQDNGMLVYDMEFRYSGYEYEYEINAVSGEIEDVEKDFDSYYDNNGNPIDYTTDASMADYISKEDAKAAALNHAGLSEGEIMGYEIELDNENGVVYYEIEFRSGEYDYEYKIDATSGSVILHEKEIDD